MWRVCVAVDDPAGGSFASLAARPGGGFDVTEAVPVKRRFNAVMLWPGCRARLH